MTIGISSSSNIITRSRSKKDREKRNQLLASTVCNNSSDATTNSPTKVSRGKKRGYEHTMTRCYVHRLNTDTALARYFRNGLKRSLMRRRGKFRYGPDEDKITCVSSRPSGDTLTWAENSCGNTWIAVSGSVNSQCVVSVNTRPEQCLKEYSPEDRPPVSVTVQTVLSDMGEKTSAFSRKVKRFAWRKAFAVVSVAPDTFDGDQESVNKAVSCGTDFLKAKLGESTTPRLTEIAPVAVCALKHVLGPQFNPDLIEVAMYDGSGITFQGTFGTMEKHWVEKCLAFDEASASDDSAITTKTCYPDS